jgi:hypothetical protein
MSLLNVGLNAGISLDSGVGENSALSNYASGFNNALALAGIGGGIGGYGDVGSTGLFQSVAGSFQQPLSSGQLSSGQTLQTVQSLLQQAQATSNPAEAQQLITAARDLLNGGSVQGGGSMPGGCGGGGYTAVGPGASGGLTSSGDSVDTGEYTITSTNQNGGTTTITNNETGQTYTVWGDPHLSCSNGQAGEFQDGPMTIQLSDGTDVEIVPTAKNSNGVAYTSQVIVTRGNGAVVLTGQQSSSGVTSSGVLDGGGPIMANNFPSDTVLTMGNNGTLYESNGQAVGDNPSTDLDNLGGAIDGSGGGFSPLPIANPIVGSGGNFGPQAGGGSQMNQIMGMLQEILQMVEQLAGSQGLSSGGLSSGGLSSGAGGGADPMSQIMSMLSQILQNTEGGGGAAAPQQSSGSSTGSEIGSIVSAVLPIALAFL